MRVRSTAVGYVCTLESGSVVPRSRRPHPGPTHE